MKLDINKTLRFLAFVTLIVFSFNVSTIFGHGYHYEEEIQTEQRQDFIDEHTHY
mgnify:CR=1 FL=1